MKCWRRGGRFIISRHGPALTPTPPSQALLPRSLCPISSASSKHPRLFCRMSLPTAWQATVAAFARRPGSMLTGLHRWLPSIRIFSSHVYGPVLLGGWFSIDTDFPHNMHDYALGSLFC